MKVIVCKISSVKEGTIPKMGDRWSLRRGRLSLEVLQKAQLMIDLQCLVDPDNRQLLRDPDQTQEVQVMRDLNWPRPQMRHFWLREKVVEGQEMILMIMYQL